MLSLIVAVLLGLVFAFFAAQNTGGVALRFGGYEFANIPIYLVAVGSLLLGLLVSWIINTIDWIGSAFTIRGKESQIKAAEQTIEDLRQRVHQLEMDNAQLSSERDLVVEQKSQPVYQEPQREYVEEVRRPSLLDRIRHAFTPRRPVPY